jgi:hypothetical protein
MRRQETRGRRELSAGRAQTLQQLGHGASAGVGGEAFGPALVQLFDAHRIRDCQRLGELLFARCYGPLRGEGFLVSLALRRRQCT